MHDDARDLMNDLMEYGELHVELDSGAEYHLHKHDVDRDGDTIIVDSKRGFWKFDGTAAENIEYPDSHKESDA